MTDETSSTQDYALDGLAELTGRERLLVDNLLLLYLHLDPGAARAATRLGVRRAIERLRELLSSADEEAVAADARSALRVLMDPSVP